ncbi:hypothetical protein ACS0TY_029695 [Phlomoides rotata]
MSLNVTEKVSNIPMPEATISDVDFKGFGLEGITLLAKVSVSNPYSVPISIGEIAYKVKSVERQIVSGSIPDPESLKSNDTTLLEVTVKVSHSAVVSLVHDIGGDWDIDYLLELSQHTSDKDGTQPTAKAIQYGDTDPVERYTDLEK